MTKKQIENAANAVFQQISDFVYYEFDKCASQVYIEVMESRGGKRKALVRGKTAMYDLERKQIVFPGCCHYCVGFSGGMTVEIHDKFIATRNISIHSVQMYTHFPMCDNCKELQARDAIIAMNIKIDHLGFKTVEIELERR